MDINFWEDLNPEQREAVLHGEGPVLVLAGAGSGKTRVIAYRIAYLVGHLKVKPENILALTFTNKAAEEMKERVEKVLGRDELGVSMGTFHSLCARVLRKGISYLGLKGPFVIYDEADQLHLIRDCMKELGLQERFYSPRVIASRISSLKNALLSPEEYAPLPRDYFSERVAHLYTLYQERLRLANALDFDDLLMVTVRLFEDRPEILHSYQSLWQYILVDEYQDTNHAQYRLVNLLSSRHGNLFVVGDDDQSIYGWRGADLSNILNFEQDHPGCKVIRLEQNYRSTCCILDAAGAVVSCNIGRKGKKLWTENEKGEPIVHYQAYNPEDEANFVARTIKSLRLEEGFDYQDFAIFYRTNAQSRAIEEGFRRHLIPYTIVGGVRFYERKEIKDLLSYLRLITNPHDLLSLRRAINVPSRGLGQAVVEKIADLARKEGVSLLEACRRLAKRDVVLPRQARALGEFYDLMEWHRVLAQDNPPSRVLLSLLEKTGYIQELQAEGTPEAENRLENLQELIAGAHEFEAKTGDNNIQAFLDSVALIAEVDEWRNEQRGVTLMTLHAAKGLEFPGVFITGMEEGVFPHNRSLEDPEELEEERRLFYVGMTRAKKRLFLTRAERRRLHGGGGNSLPSRFLSEVPSHLIKSMGSQFTVHSSRRTDSGVGDFIRQPFTVNREPVEPFVDYVQPGVRVRHPEWGIGTIRKRIGNGENLKVDVDFPKTGRKRLAVKYAQLERA